MTHFWIWSTGVLKEIIRNKENLGLLSASAVVLENNERSVYFRFFSALKTGTLPLLSGSVYSV